MEETVQTTTDRTPARRAWKIVSRAITGLILAFAVFMMLFTIVSVTTFDRTDRSLFGFKAFIVLSDSMKATDFAAGDLIFVREVDPSTLKEGDIICFQSTNKESYGEIVTHKIRRLTEDSDGSPGFVTYGTTTDTDDEAIVLYTFVIGKYEGKIAGLGHFFQFLKTTPGYLVCILLPFLLLILWQGAGAVRLFLQYKREQRAEIEAEKQKLEAERLEAQKMMAELLSLREQMNREAPGQTDEGSDKETPKETDEKALGTPQTADAPSDEVGSEADPQTAFEADPGAQTETTVETG